MFKDRNDAGRQLAEKLAKYGRSDAVVLALPRGGVVTGYEVAKRLGLPLDIVVTRKIGHPLSPEYAIAAVDDMGTTLLNDAEAESINRVWLADEIDKQKKEALRRITAYRGERRPVVISGKTVLIVDDGIATGLTMRLAVHRVKAQHPVRIVVAVPVAPSEAVEDLRKEADEIITLVPPGEFLGAVGSHYNEFAQVADTEVKKLLAGKR